MNIDKKVVVVTGGSKGFLFVAEIARIQVTLKICPVTVFILNWI
jgi:UDP-N-acetylglucosamine:LPS N-acetylglucosamine transferase